MTFGNEPKLVSFVGWCCGQSVRQQNRPAGFLIVDKRTASVLCSLGPGEFQTFRIGRVEQCESFALSRQHIAISNQLLLLTIKLMVELSDLLPQLYLAAPKHPQPYQQRHKRQPRSHP